LCYTSKKFLAVTNNKAGKKAALKYKVKESETARLAQGSNVVAEKEKYYGNSF
jgi:hypothetical protein